MIRASWFVLLEEMFEGYRKWWQTSFFCTDCHAMIQRCSKAEALQFIFKLPESPPSFHPSVWQILVFKENLWFVCDVTLRERVSEWVRESVCVLGNECTKTKNKIYFNTYLFWRKLDVNVYNVLTYFFPVKITILRSQGLLSILVTQPYNNAARYVCDIVLHVYVLLAHIGNPWEVGAMV